MTRISETFSPSKTQKQRFESLLLVAAKRRPSGVQIAELLAKNYLIKDDGNLSLTDTGSEELGRLGFFLGYLQARGVASGP